MLSLCNDLDYPMHLFADAPGKPILLTNSETQLQPIPALQAALGQITQIQPGAVRFTADIVLATLQTDVEPTQQPQPANQSQSQQQNIHPSGSQQPKGPQHGSGSISSSSLISCC